MSHETRLEEALFRHLVNNSGIPLVGGAIGSLLVALAQTDSLYRNFAFIWMSAVYTALAIRFWLVRRCQARLAVTGYVPEEAKRYAFTSSLSGIAWGMSGVFILNASPIAMVVTITATQAMVMGGALTLGVFLPAFFAFTLPAILPMIAMLAINGSTENIILATYSAIFLVLTIGIARRFNNSLRHTWQLTFDKEDLLNALTAAHDQQSFLAKTDALTGIANRRRFDDVLEKEIARLQRSETKLSLLILDVDHFKAFNDTYGHIAGDGCLKRIANVLQKNICRTSDLAARYGGEEFAGILPETKHAGAILLAEQIRAEVEALNIPHEASPIARHITVSIGITTITCSASTKPEDVIALADQQLYRAKSEGRNRVASSNAG